MPARFRSLTGRKLAGIWSAPGRVNLIGEHTDYNSGFVLPIAIDRRTFVAAAARSDRVLRGWSSAEAGSFEVPLNELQPGSLGGWPAYACAPAWVLAQQGIEVAGADLLVLSEVPVGGGLSSSAALQVSIALALSEMAGAPLSGIDLAMAAHRAESEFVGVPVGTMDQTISALGRRSTALFLDTRDMHHKYVPFAPEPAGFSLVVLDTRVKHRLAEGQYAERRKTCREAAAAMGLPSLREATLEIVESALLSEVQRKRARHVVTENQRVLEVVKALGRYDLGSVGDSFLRSHASLRLDYEVSSPELDLAVESAVSAGALGVRMTGGGFGGSAIALVPSPQMPQMCEAVSAAFAAAGFGPPAAFPVQASDGAIRNA